MLTTDTSAPGFSIWFVLLVLFVAATIGGTDGCGSNSLSEVAL